MNKTTFVILAAGRGTRLWPVGEGLPKCMVRVLGKPLIEWTVEGIEKHADKIVIVVGYMKDFVIDHFRTKEYADKIVFVEQKEQKGTGHAFLCAKNEVQGNFVTLYADNFYDPSFYKFLTSTIEQDPTKNYCFSYHVDDVRAYGQLNVQNNLFKGVKEKPKEKQNGQINLGCYYLSKDYFKHLEKVRLSPRGEYEATDALNTFIKEQDIHVIEYKGYRNEMTYWWNHLDINVYALEHLMNHEVHGKVEPGAYIEGKVHIGKGTLVRAGTRIEGPAYIGEDCLIGPNAFIRPGSVIENRCHIGTSEIKNAVVMHDSNVPHFSFVGDSVLCEDVNLGAGTMLVNLRFDDENVKVKFKQERIDTGKRKLGSAIGHGTKIGGNAVINCGVMLGHNCKIYPGVKVMHNLDNDTIYKGEEIEHK